jgi:hypothetical protein
MAATKFETGQLFWVKLRLRPGDFTENHYFRTSYNSAADESDRDG